MTFDLADEAATLALGKKMAAALHAGMTIYLFGNLGAGKTTLTRGILHGLGYHHVVKSPTYNLVEIYKISRLYFYHFDFYRFNDYPEWEEAGFREYLIQTQSVWWNGLKKLVIYCQKLIYSSSSAFLKPGAILKSRLAQKQEHNA